MKLIPMKNKEAKQADTKQIIIKQMNGKSKQVLAVVLGGSLVFSMMGAGVYAAGLRNGEASGPEVIAAENVNVGGRNNSGVENGSTVEETVYVIAGADGTAQKIIVSDWMKDANGKDSYTQENLQKELPVDMAISYRLDGKEVSAEELAGKSGKLTMRFDYINRQYEDVEINGETKRIYVPFVMLTGMVLDNDRFTNVEVSNGRVINDGDRTIVAGFAVPGLQESLELDKEKLELPEYVEVTADVKDFELETTMTVATTEVFSEMDLNESDTFDELDESMGQLTDAMEQLTDGSSALYDGMTELLDKSGDLINGIGQLAEGASALVVGAGDLKAGAGEVKTGAGDLQNGADTLKTGTGELQTGASDLKSGAGALKSGAGELKTGANDLQTGAAALQGGAGELKNGMGDLKTGAEGLKAGIDNVKAGADSLQEGAERLNGGLEMLEEQSSTVMGGAGQVFDALLAAGSQQIASFGIGTLDRNNYGAVLDQAIGIASGVAPDAVPQLSALKSQLDAYSSFYYGLGAYTDGVVQASAGAAELTDGAGRLADGAGQLADGAGQLVDGAGRLVDGADRLEGGAGQLTDGAGRLMAGAEQLEGGIGQLESGAGRLEGGAGQLADGAGQLADGAGRLAAGAGQLENGAGQLAGGMDTLHTGIGQLQSGSGALVDGVEQLQDGALQLSDGIKEFNEEGIQALVDAFDGDLKELKNRMTAVSDAAKHYKSFKNNAKDKGQSVRFIYKTEKIGEE